MSATTFTRTIVFQAQWFYTTKIAASSSATADVTESFTMVMWPVTSPGLVSVSLWSMTYVSASQGSSAVSSGLEASTDPSSQTTTASLPTSKADSSSTQHSTMPMTSFGTSVLHSNAESRHSTVSSVFSTSSPIGGSSRITPGALVGVAIGCAIAGAMITTILACLLIRQRRRVPLTLSRRTSLRGTRDANGMEASDTVMMGLTKFDTQSTLEDLLPSPLDHKELAEAIRRFCTAIKNHAHGFYNGGDGLTTGLDNAMLSALLGASTPFNVKALASLLSNRVYAATAIRFLLAWSILRCTSGCGPVERTLLPPELAACLDAMPGFRSNEDESCNFSLPPLRADQPPLAARNMLLSKWRQLSAVLVQSTCSGDGIAEQDNRQRNIQNLVEALDSVLAPLASKHSSRERRYDLEELVKKGAHFGFVIFSQPTNWTFEWQHPTGEQKDDLVVFPALVQVSDELGRTLSNPQPLTEAQTVRVASTALHFE